MGVVGFTVPAQDDGTASVAITSPVWGPFANVPGTTVGNGRAFASAVLSSKTTMSGPIVVAEPEKYLDAAARCGLPAPDAAWLLELSHPGDASQRLVIPIFLGRDAGLLRLQLCFDSPTVASASPPKIVSLLISTNEFPAVDAPGR
jgi:hypothetical protein